MGTISDKLNKLVTTKESIKSAIISKGVSVTDSDTFASYANKIFISRNSVNTKTCDITTTENCKYIKIGFKTTDPESSFANYTLIKKQ